MPTFFEGFKRLLTGQPVFRQGEDIDGVEYKEDRQPEPQVDQLDQPPAAEAVKQQGPKLIPEVAIQRVEYRSNGADMEVDAYIKNTSSTEIMLDRIMILGTTHQLDYVLRPGEQREFPIFNGRRPDNRNYTHCELQYRDQATGDYFSAIHNVEFEQEADKTYVVRRIRFIPPVKDI